MGNMLKIGNSSNGGKLVINLKEGVSIRKIKISGFGWKNTLVVTAANAASNPTVSASSASGPLPLANKTNVTEGFANAGSFELVFTQAVTGTLVISASNTALCITGLELFSGSVA